MDTTTKTKSARRRERRQKSIERRVAAHVALFGFGKGTPIAGSVEIADGPLHVRLGFSATAAGRRACELWLGDMTEAKRTRGAHS